jgi:hypothetical protein
MLISQAKKNYQGLNYGVAMLIHGKTTRKTNQFLLKLTGGSGDLSSRHRCRSRFSLFLYQLLVENKKIFPEIQ